MSLRYRWTMMPVFILAFFVLFVHGAEAAPVEVLVKQAEAALFKADYQKAQALISEAIQKDSGNTDILRLIVHLDISTMQMSKMLYDYKEYTRRLGREDPDTLAFAIVSLLQKALAHANYYLRSAAVKSIGDMGSPKLLPLVLPALNDDVSYVRFFAVETLGIIGDDNILPYLKELFEREDDASVKIEIVKVLITLGTKKARYILEELQDTDSPGARMIITGYLGSDSPTSTLTLLGLKYQEEDPLVKAFAIYSMGKVKGNGSMRYFRKSATHDESMVRSYTALALSESETKEGISLLKSMLADKDPVVKAHAVRTLAGYSNTEEDLFLELMKDPDPYIQSEAFRGLRLKGNHNGDEIFFHLLSNEDYEVRHSALLRLADTGQQSDLPWIKKSLEDPVDRVRIAAVRALGKIRGKESLQLLKEKLGDKDSIVQVYAAGNLGGIIYNTHPRVIDGRE